VSHQHLLVIGAQRCGTTYLRTLLDEQVAPLATVAEVRRCGFMTGIELTPFPVHARMGHQVTLAARRRGAIVRPLGDVVVLMPPLSIETDELARLVEITAAAIAEATGARPARGHAATARRAQAAPSPRQLDAAPH